MVQKAIDFATKYMKVSIGRGPTDRILYIRWK